MKALTTVFSLFGVMAIFGFGFTMNHVSVNETEIEQIHLSCWDQQGTSSVERVRLTLDKSMHGLVWFSNFAGDPTGEGTVIPRGSANASTLQVDVIGKQSFTAQIPNFAFQPHIRSLRMSVGHGETLTPLECRKINLAKRQSMAANQIN